MQNSLTLEESVERASRCGLTNAIAMPAYGLVDVRRVDVIAILFRGRLFEFSSAQRLDYDTVCVNVKSNTTGASVGHNARSGELVTIYVAA